VTGFPDVEFEIALLHRVPMSRRPPPSRGTRQYTSFARAGIGNALGGIVGP